MSCDDNTVTGVNFFAAMSWGAWSEITLRGIPDILLRV